MTDVASLHAGEAPTGDETEVLVERLFAATIESLETAFLVHLGCTLGLYRALADGGDAIQRQLAARTGTAERYVREWLEQQAVAGFLTVDDAGRRDPQERRYGLPTVVQGSVRRRAGPALPGAALIARDRRAADQWTRLLAAYRRGTAVPYEAYGADARDGLAALNRPMFTNQLAGGCPRSPRSRTAAGHAGARVLDLAVGPPVEYRHRPRLSGRDGRRHRRGHGVDRDRPRQRRRGRAGRPGARHASTTPASEHLDGPYHLVTIFEALHDMNHPVDVLRPARASLAEGGSVVIGDERVADASPRRPTSSSGSTTAGASCTASPSAMLDDDSAGTGTVLGRTRAAYATDAGFGQVDVLPIDHEFWRFYRLVP